jgi:excisionase family DNA binding protein
MPGMNARGTGQKNEDRRRIDALLDKLYTIAMRGNVAAAGLYLERVLGAVQLVPAGEPRELTTVEASGRSHATVVESAKPKRLLSVAEVAETLGVSKAMVYSLKRTGTVDVVRIGRRVLVRVEDVERLMGSRADHA